MREGLGGWIGRKLRLGIKRQGEAARKELEAHGIPIETLRLQWEDQCQKQLSVRAREFRVLFICMTTYLYHSSLDAPARLKRELDVVLSLQSDIDSVETALKSTRTLVGQRDIPASAHKAIQSLENNHARLIKNVESLYASLNVHESFPELKGLSLDFVRLLLMARDLKINIRKRAVASFFEWDRLDRAVGGKQNPLGKLLIRSVVWVLT